MGCIYKRGEKYWIKYYRSSKPYLESTHSEKEADAKRLLKKREGEISEGRLPGIFFDKVRFDELAEDYLTDYQVNKRRSLKKAEKYVEYLKQSFGGSRVTEITTARINQYINTKIEEGKANATINRELSALKRMFHLAKRSRKVNEIPYIPMLKESNVRKGFFEYDQFLSVRDALPDYLKSIVTFGYHSGWRKGEILGLTWEKVDLKQGIIRLDPGETKNDEARTLYMNDELLREMRLVHGKRRLGCPFVFHHDGEPVRKFEKAWKAACKKVGLKGRLFHDFRRTAARNMVRCGIPERVAMVITGHKTRSIFDRYNIVSEQDLREAAIKQQAYINSQESSQMVTKTVTVSYPSVTTSQNH